MSYKCKQIKKYLDKKYRKSYQQKHIFEKYTCIYKAYLKYLPLLFRRT